MGRHKTGATTTTQVLRIELSYLLKNNYLQNGQKIIKLLSWTSKDNIRLESYLNDGSGYLNLIYTLTTPEGIKTEHNDKVEITSTPSNLGKGKVLYFVCPQTSKRCRILYKCYDSEIWKSREAYKNRIYYNTQICTKFYYHTERYYDLERQLRDFKKPIKSHYQGKTTKRAIQYQRLQGLNTKHNLIRLKMVENLLNERYNNFN